MSYCRWSSDDFSCDLYCFESVHGGWVTHIADNRVVGDIPKLPPWPKKRLESPEEITEWSTAMEAAYRTQTAFLDTCEREVISLPHAGETIHSPTLEHFQETLIMLRDLGYRFPDDVLMTVAREIEFRDEEAGDDQA